MDVCAPLSSHDPSTWRETLGVASGDRSADVVALFPDRVPRGAGTPAGPRREIHIGDLVVELHQSLGERQSSVDLRVRDQHAALLIPIMGWVGVLGEGLGVTCAAGTNFLFSRDDTAKLIWPSSSWGVLVHLRRARVNAAASTLCGDARRLASIAVALEASDLDALFGHLARCLFSGAEGDELRSGPALQMVEAQFYQRLAERLVTHDDRDALVAPVRSISEAMRTVRKDHCRPFDTDSLALAAGVTAQTLRKGFKSCLGMSVKEFVQLVRLEWAHDRLASARDSRSITALAAKAGFSSAAIFSRAYLKRYGEPPSQTRARAVRRARE